MSMFYSMDKVGAFNPQRASNMLDGGTPYYGAYETADGKHVSVGPIEPQFFAEMIHKAGLPEEFIAKQMDPTSWGDLKAALTAAFQSKTRDQWVEIFEGSDACVAGILDIREAIEHPHNAARKTYVQVGNQMQPAPAPRFSRTECELPAPPSSEGTDTRSVLADWGFAPSSIEALDAAGILT